MVISITNCQIVLHLANLVTFDLRLTYLCEPLCGNLDKVSQHYLQCIQVLD